MEMPELRTARLVVRPFRMDDLRSVYQILDLESGITPEDPEVLRARERWLQWTVLNYPELANLHQPPYGERAVVSIESEALVGVVGLVPCLDAFEQLPSFAVKEPSPLSFNSAQVGLFWTTELEHRGQGYATEAAQVVIDYAFSTLKLRRIVATTDHDNLASLGVMRKLGMHVERNPLPEPPWLQAVGILEHPLLRTSR